jgi:hypothetical protein
MCQDLTETIPQNDDDKLTLILKTVLSTSVRVDNIDLRLGRVEQTVGELQEGQQRLEAGQQRLELGQEVLRSDFETLKRSVSHNFLTLSGQVQASYNKLEERVTCLEHNTNPPNSQT